jgi:hypothetical protein
MGTSEDGSCGLSDDFSVLSVTIEDGIDLGLVRDLVLEHDVLVLHVVEVPQAHAR